MDSLIQNRVAEMNARLNSLYEHISKQYPTELVGDLPLSGPFLIRVTDQYADADRKIMLVGQETYGWYSYKDYCDKENVMPMLFDWYTAFVLGRDPQAKGPFWNEFRRIEGALCNGVHGSIIWQNLMKFDYNCRSVFKAAAEIQDLVFRMQKDLFKEEMNIVSPHAVIFFTGTGGPYDGMIKREYPSSIFEEIEESRMAVRHWNRSLENKITVHRIRDHDLPLLTLRTYHPHFLYLQGRENKNRIIGIIESQIEKELRHLY
jgi:hypothetical protein